MKTLAEEIFDVDADDRLLNRSETVRAIAKRYARHFSIVREVLDGKTTFEKAVTPLVEENLRIKFPYRNGACNTEKARHVAAAARGRLHRLIPLEMRHAVHRYYTVRIDLTARAEMSMLWLVLPALTLMAPVAGFNAWHLIHHPEVCTPGGITQCVVGGAVITLIAGLIGFFYSTIPVNDVMDVRRRFAGELLMNARKLDGILKMHHP